MARPKPGKKSAVSKDKARTVVYVDKEIFKAFKHLTVEQGITFSKALENAMADYIERYKERYELT